MSERLTNQVIDLLDVERQALRQGAFEVLDEVAAEKIALFDSLAKTGAPRTMLAQIKTKLGENAELLSAALRGVGAARLRIEELQQVREHLSVYDRAGQMASVANKRPGLEKKA